MAHKHIWHLAEYRNSHLIDVGDKVMAFKPAQANWVCPCGVQKLTEVSDLPTEGLEPSAGHSEAQ